MIEFLKKLFMGGLVECHKEENVKNCNCSYQYCNKTGLCCQCILYHRKNRELPACFFDNSSEKTYNRSYEFFADLVKNGKV